MSNVIDIRGILEARNVVINASRVADRILEESEQYLEDEAQWRKFVKSKLEMWLDEGNGRQE